MAARMFIEEFVPTQNLGAGTNDRLGVAVHHTAGSLAGDLATLTRPGQAANGGSVSAHALIARDGDRYILAADDAVTWHAGRSRFRGRDYANGFLLGVEFEGNTLDAPLTDAQVASFVEWFVPRAKVYGWQSSDIVGHAALRAAWNAAYPDRSAPATLCMSTQAPGRLRAAVRDALGPADVVAGLVPAPLRRQLGASQEVLAVGLAAAVAVPLALLTRSST